MKKDETMNLKLEFLKLRAIEGKSFDVISNEINVSKPTLIKWERASRSAIDQIRSAEIQNLISCYNHSLKNRLGNLIKLSQRLEVEVLDRDLSSTPVNKLVEMLLVTNDRIAEIETNNQLSDSTYDLKIERCEYFTET
jgi:hypothetical protein